MIQVDVWSDIACPWCYIGKRRFAEGVRRFQAAGGDAEITITYHSFELAPDTPVDFDGNEVDFLVRHKGLQAGQVRQMLAHMVELAATEGLSYDFDALQHTNTRKAHELLHIAKVAGVQEAMKERLLKAYFTEGRHLGHLDELADLAAEVGLDRATVTAQLEAATYAPAVQADVDQARAYGINGVPFFVLDGRYGVSGAQGPDAFAEVLAKVHADMAAEQD